MNLCQSLSDEGLSLNAGSVAAGLLWQQAKSGEQSPDLLMALVAVPAVWLLSKVLIR